MCRTRPGADLSIVTEPATAMPRLDGVLNQLLTIMAARAGRNNCQEDTPSLSPRFAPWRGRGGAKRKGPGRLGASDTHPGPDSRRLPPRRPWKTPQLRRGGASGPPRLDPAARP